MSDQYTIELGFNRPPHDISELAKSVSKAIEGQRLILKDKDNLIYTEDLLAEIAKKMEDQAQRGGKTMKLTRAEAINQCKKLWREIEKSGLGKEDFLLETEEGEKWNEQGLANDCPLCEYSSAWLSCRSCPLPKEKDKAYRLAHRCYGLGFTDDCPPNKEWLAIIKALK